MHASVASEGIYFDSQAYIATGSCILHVPGTDEKLYIDDTRWHKIEINKGTAIYRLHAVSFVCVLLNKYNMA